MTILYLWSFYHIFSNLERAITTITTLSIILHLSIITGTLLSKKGNRPDCPFLPLDTQVKSAACLLHSFCFNLIPIHGLNLFQQLFSRISVQLSPLGSVRMQIFFLPCCFFCLFILFGFSFFIMSLYVNINFKSAKGFIPLRLNLG